MKIPSIKIQLIIFLSIFAFYLSIINRDIAFLSAICISVISAVLLDSLITYLKSGHFVITDSSIVSGLIIGYVISVGEPWWKFLLASIFAISSKHLIRSRNKHLFNPAAFGIFLAAILLRADTQWAGTDLWFVLVPAGIYFIWKIHKLELLTGYILSYLILFGGYALIRSLPILDVLKYQNFFFIFIMLIEPKTSPVNKNGKLVFGIAAAILIFIFTESRVSFDAEICSLLILNIFSPLLNRLS